ncbi:hypothetical protein ALC57_08590 [Trachymyrmex cornetzi]|uniref:Uncharacterized protein n=1 Tax=Trachymyrmex cornetzi TaxID=471704 RepID=A0A151J796_9HYME|nr:hypothetical protein ALC57_08590 [Trachymyrmex cornetzi]
MASSRLGQGHIDFFKYDLRNIHIFGCKTQNAERENLTSVHFVFMSRAYMTYN